MTECMHVCASACKRTIMLMRVAYECARAHVNVSALVYACVQCYKFCVLMHVHGRVLAYECICVYMCVVFVNAFLFSKYVLALAHTYV